MTPSAAFAGMVGITRSQEEDRKAFLIWDQAQKECAVTCPDLAVSLLYQMAHESPFKTDSMFWLAWFDGRMLGRGCS